VKNASWQPNVEYSDMTSWLCIQENVNK